VRRTPPGRVPVHRGLPYVRPRHRLARPQAGGAEPWGGGAGGPPLLRQKRQTENRTGPAARVKVLRGPAAERRESATDQGVGEGGHMIRCQFCHVYIPEGEYASHRAGHTELLPDGQQLDYTSLPPDDRYHGECE